MSEKIKCPKCGKTLQLRKDGALPKHMRYRRWVTLRAMGNCSWGGGWLEWLSDGSVQVLRQPHESAESTQEVGE